MRKITAERGYIIPAFNTDTVDYRRCAEQLQHSIQLFDSTANVTIIDNDDIPYKLLGYGNDIYAYALSPYRQTIKLEADMVIASPINHWWTMLEHRDLVISTGCRDFYDNPSQSRFYRKTFDDNNLPDVYNAVTYWRRSDLAHEFFTLVQNIFENWYQYRSLLKFCDDEASTDLVYAIAAQIIGPDLCTLPFASYPKIVHMKKHITPIATDDWTKELVWETNPLRVQTVAQWGAFHYHQKTWKI